jgi:hypothetical protein
MAPAEHLCKVFASLPQFVDWKMSAIVGDLKRCYTQITRHKLGHQLGQLS